MAEVRGEALVPSFIVPDQILQTLKKRLLYTLGHLEGWGQPEETEKKPRKAKKPQQQIHNSKPESQRL